MLLFICLAYLVNWHRGRKKCLQCHYFFTCTGILGRSHMLFWSDNRCRHQPQMGLKVDDLFLQFVFVFLSYTCACWCGRALKPLPSTFLHSPNSAGLWQQAAGPVTLYVFSPLKLQDCFFTWNKHVFFMNMESAIIYKLCCKLCII